MGTIYTWKSGDVGDWSTGADWGAGSFPNSGTATAVISGTGSDVTIGYGESFTVAALTLGGSTPTLDIQGTLAFAGTANTLAFKSGLLEIQGELANADIVQTGGSLVLSGATLSNDTYSGTLNVSGYYNALYIENGLTATGGVINLTDPTYGYESLQFLDSETLNSQTIVVGETGGGTISDAYGTLTLGAKTEILQSATTTEGGTIYGNIVNDGLISIAAAQFNIASTYDYATGQYDDTFVNAASGTIAIGSTGTVVINVPTFDNAGLITVASGGLLDLQFADFIDTGKISLAAGSTLEIQQSIALGQLGSIITGSGALIDIDGGGTLNLGGGTLDVKTGGEFANVEVNYGTLENGFIAASDGGTLTLNRATLSGDTYSGTLNVSGYYNALYIENGLTATGGVINLTDPTYGYESLQFLDSETLNSQTIVVGETSGYGGGTISDAYGTLTLGAKTEILQSATTTEGGTIYGNIVNDGLISIAAAQFNIASTYDYATGQYDDTFVNAASGTIAIGSTGTVVINVPTFDNAGLITVASGGLLDLQSADFIDTGKISLAADGLLAIQQSIALSQLGSIITGTGAIIDIDSGGTLNLNGGTLDIKTGGEFGNVEVINGGTLENGFVAANDGGTLTLTNAVLSAVTYSGTLNVLGAYNDLYIENGLTATGGVINLVDPNYGGESLQFLDSETLSNQTIAIGDSNGYGSDTIYDQYGTLTLGANTKILQAVPTTQGSEIAGNIVNDGLISVTAGYFYIASTYDIPNGSVYDDNFVNAATGTIAVGGGGNVYINVPTFNNAGLITVASGGVLDLQSADFIDTGKISLAADGLLAIQQSIALSQLGSIITGTGAIIDIDSGGTLNLNGGTLDIKTGGEFGNVEVINGGTLENGFVAANDGGTLTLTNAVLSAVTYSGTLNVLGAYNDLYIENGLTATGGVINLVDPNYGGESLQFLDSETLSNQTIAIGDSNGYGSDTIYDQYGTLTLGANTKILQAVPTTQGSEIAGNIVNDGLISVTAGYFYIASTYDIPNGSVYDDNFVNAATGTIAVGGGGNVYINVPTFNNAGLITVASGGVLDLQSADFIDTGKISLAADGLLAIQQSIALSQLGSIITGTGAIIDIDSGGTLNLNGGTLDIKTGGEFGNVEVINGGTLENGFVAANDGGTLTLTNAVLSAVTYSGTLNVLGAYNDLYIENGLTATGGVINLVDPNYGGESLQFLDSETLSNQTIAIGDSNGYGSDTIYDQYGTLTLGANTKILQAVPTTQGSEIAGNIVNDGLISVTAGYFYIASTYDIPNGSVYDDNFVNAATGTIALSGGAQLIVSTPTFDNLGLIDLKASSATISPSRFVNEPSGTLSGGTYEIEAGSTLVLPHILTTDAADIILSGTSSTVLGNTTTLEHSLTSVTSAGILQVLGGRNYAATGTLTDAGQIVLGGGSFSAAALTVAAGGTVSGAGVLGGVLTNNGLITAAGGNLRLNSLVSGTGSLGINAGATLELAAGTAETVTFGTPTSLHGTLKLDAPAAFTGTLAGLALGDVIDIGGSTVAATSFSGASLFITLSSGTTLSEKLGGALPANERFGITSDGGTGSDLTLYQEASYSLAPTTLAFQAHVGDTVASDLTIANTQPPGFTEGLDASFSSAGPGITASGSITTLAAGASNSTALQITLSTATAGSISSSAVVTLASDGAGTDGQSPLSLGSQTVAVSGAVFNYATASAVAPGSIAFGENHVGAVDTQTLAIGNVAAAGAYSENLDASFSGTSSDLTTTGSVSELAAGATSTALSVTLNAATAGSFIGVTTLGLTSDGSTIDTLGTTALPGQTVTVTGEFFNLATASAAAPNPISFGQAHVGSTLAQLLTISNGAAAGAFSENLDATFSGTSGSLTDSGTVSELVAGATSGSALAVSLNSGTAGVQSGTATLALSSDGSTIDTLGTTALAPETVTASGTLFNYATASTVAPVNFGIVHVGQTAVSQVVVLNNTAAPGAFSENLDGSFSGTSASFTTSGSVSELTAGSGSGTALNIGLQTGKSGIITGFTTLNVTSDGTGIDTLGTTALAPETIAVTGTVDAYAAVGISLISGPGKLGGSGGKFTLNLGSVVLGSTAPAESIGIENTAKGQADLLKGTLALSGTTSAFTNNSGTSFTGIAAGSESTGHTISLHTGAVGTFTETIVLSPTGYNASGYAGTLAPDTLVVTGTVTAAGAVAGAVSPLGASPTVMSFATPASASGTPTAFAPVTGLQAGLAGAGAHWGMFAFASDGATAASAATLAHGLATASVAGAVTSLGLAGYDLHKSASAPVAWAGATLTS